MISQSEALSRGNELLNAARNVNARLSQDEEVIVRLIEIINVALLESK